MRPWLQLSRDWRRPSDARGWQLWWSDAGAFGQIHPRPAPDEIAGFYDLESYYTHDARTDGARAPGLADRLRVALAARLDRGVQPDAAFWASVVPQGAELGLEIGTGNGDRMLDLAPLMQEIIGLEPDPKACATARGKGLTVHPGTAEDLPDEITARRYDFLLFAHVLEHCADPMLALRNATDLLTERGVMVLETPNNAAFGLTQQGAGWLWLDVPRHLNFFTETSLRAFAGRAGLRVVDCQYWGYCRQVLPDWLEQQATIAACLDGRSEPKPADLARQRAQAWALIARTALAGRARKYDSVRLICQRA
jgi:2-polyprenyl-3-methyl-5-hydroxy-6-metoxy-1,4-benzoquinol methylase